MAEKLQQTLTAWSVETIDSTKCCFLQWDVLLCFLFVGLSAFTSVFKSLSSHLLHGILSPHFPCSTKSNFGWCNMLVNLTLGINLRSFIYLRCHKKTEGNMPRLAMKQLGNCTNSLKASENEGLCMKIDIHGINFKIQHHLVLKWSYSEDF